MIFDGDLHDLTGLIDFLGETLGENIEFTLHDLSKPGKTIIAIKNGSVTNRKIGDSISDFTQKVIDENIRNTDDLKKLQASVNALRKDIKSSDMLILGSDGRIRGMLSINVDKKPFQEMQKCIDSMIGQPVTSLKNKKSPTNGQSFRELAEAMIEVILEDTVVSPERMTFDERMKTIQEFDEKGIFQLKGSTSIVAQRLGVSEATVYRYVNSLPKKR